MAGFDSLRSNRVVANLAYDAMLQFWRVVTNIFFREIRPRGAYNIPREGPVIFAVAPHHNQVNVLCSAAFYYFLLLNDSF